jgi:glycosyltransferase involved in cell wall biosynthesis
MILRIMGYSDSTVLFIHGWDNRLFENVAKHKYLRHFICWLYSNIAAILVLSNKFRLQLKQINIPLERIKVTTTMYVRTPSVSLFPMNKKINILFMSRFVREKGLYIAAETAKLLHDNEGISCSFTFAGDGIEMEGFKSYLAKHDLKGFVDLVGYVSGRKKDEILLRSEIFLFPTQYGEGCPVSILEAMGAGLAIISTPVGGIPEVVEDGINGFLHDSVNPLIFYKTVKRLIEDRKLLTEIQKRNIKKAERYYESSIVGKKIEELYNEVAKINK